MDHDVVGVRAGLAVVTTKDRFLSLVDMSASPPAMLEPQCAEGLGVRWSPNGDRFVYFAESGDSWKNSRPELWVCVPGEQPRLLHRFPHNDHGWTPPVWPPDGSQVALFLCSGMDEGQSMEWIVDADTREVVDATLDAHGGAAWQPAPGAE